MDLHYLFTFHHCYTSKCIVLFAEKTDPKKDEYLTKLQKVRLSASNEVQKLVGKLEECHSDKGTLEKLVSTLLNKFDLKTTVFTKPLNSTYLLGIRRENKEEFLELLLGKLKNAYGIESINGFNNSLTDEEENTIIKSQFQRNV